MYKIINKANLVIGLMLPEGGRLKQKNLLPYEYIIVETVTEQMYNLLDPVKNQLKLERLEVL